MTEQSGETPRPQDRGTIRMDALPPWLLKQLEAARTPTEVLASRLRELRTRQNLSAQKLADRCSEIVNWKDDEEPREPKLDRAVISNLENGRREKVSLDEVFVLAFALNVSPLHLFIEPEHETFMAIGNRRIETPYVREWVRGHYALAGQDVGTFHTAAPEEEWPERLRAVVELHRAEGGTYGPPADDEAETDSRNQEGN